MTTITPGTDDMVPYLSSLFVVEFGSAGGSFTEVSGLGIDIEETESTIVKEGKEITRWSPGTVKYNEITLKREFTGDRAFWDWHMAMSNGEKKYENGSIYLMDLAGTQTARWEVERAWPSKWSCSDLDAGTADAMIEEVTLQIEFLERTT